MRLIKCLIAQCFFSIAGTLYTNRLSLFVVSRSVTITKKNHENFDEMSSFTQLGEAAASMNLLYFWTLFHASPMFEFD